MKINCIIIEDEPLALERTKAYVLKLPFLNLLATFDNGIDALVFLKSNKIDLIFFLCAAKIISKSGVLEISKLLKSN